MSFREKTAWISLLSMSGIYGLYFWSVSHSGGGTSGLLGTIIALTVVQVALTIAAAIFSPADAQAPRDERDRLIELRATRFSYSALAGSIACVCFFGAVQSRMVFGTNALLFVLVVAEVLRSGCQIVQYRRGA